MLYVPLAHSSADLIEKIEWLRRNDGMAQQLATNARNFGTSYLRVEDYLCYAGAALSLLADLEQGSDVISMSGHRTRAATPRRVALTRCLRL